MYKKELFFYYFDPLCGGFAYLNNNFAVKLLILL